MTFGEIKTKIAAYLNRDDLSSYIGDFVKLAQRKIERGGEYIINGRIVKIKGYYDCMKTRKYTTTTDYEITVPADFLSPIGMWVLVDGSYQPLNKRLPEDIWTNYPDPINNTGTPKEYATLIGEGAFIVRPTPDVEYTFDMMYYKSLTELSADADTNAWTENYWEILLYGSLLEAQSFLIADERLNTWLSLFSNAMQALEDRDTLAQAAGGFLCVKPYYTDNVEC